ncbi:phage tail protein [Parageobacillus thermoglucosidasius]|uniref:phage tail protein n=1 Tax=Parageobacillus thermoglucosidasius TaxID=1426 RepID=UPI000E1A0E85|nr:phage tail protein [Parageobacillus thermoglucosidasius]RDE19259.1 phage tail protein [Parageobacillus thermoglucosidasius]
MPEKSGFFDSTAEDPREYTADEFAEYFRRLLTDGIFNGGTNLKVEASGTDMKTHILPGYAWIQGYMYKVYDEPLYLQHDLPDAQLDRIDRIVLRLDTSLEVRSIRAVILKGEPAANPVAPSIVRENNIFDLSLAQVRIIAGKSYIEAFQITDERLDTNVCGLVNSLIQADTTEIFNQFQQWYEAKTAEYEQNFDFWKGEKAQELSDYIDNVKAQWDAWFADITQELPNYIDHVKAQWDAWFTDTTDEFTNEWRTWFDDIKQELEALDVVELMTRLNEHQADTVSHITSAERAKWNGADSKAQDLEILYWMGAI